MNWTLWLFIFGSFACKYTHAQQQRIPPGVSPQHYQQVNVPFKIIKHMVATSKFHYRFLSIILLLLGNCNNIHTLYGSIIFNHRFIHKWFIFHLFQPVQQVHQVPQQIPQQQVDLHKNIRDLVSLNF